MTINKNSTEQINVALLDLENKIKKNNQTTAISALENNITLINKTLKEKQNGLVPGETYTINISGNASTSNHSLDADNATTADYATSAGSAPIIFPEGFVYKQYYNPSTCSWEKTPAQMGMQVPSGCKWTEITANFSSYPYSKITTTETGEGHNAEHLHAMNHKHRMEHTHSGTTDGATASFSRVLWGNGTSLPWRTSGSQTTWAADLVTQYAHTHSFTTGSSAHTGSYYTGNSITTSSANASDTGRINTDNQGSGTYPEPNYHGCKLWKVVVDS